MRFETCDQLVNDYQFYVDVINELDDEWFEFLPPAMIIEEKSELIDECRRDFAFKILTKIEAEIRLDVQNRVASKWKDPISRRICELARKKAGTRQYQKQLAEEAKRIRLEDVILTVRDYFKQDGHYFHQTCSRLKGYFSFRDWYAHGRYFDHGSQFENSANTPDPQDLFDIYRDLLEHFIASTSYRKV